MEPGADDAVRHDFGIGIHNVGLRRVGVHDHGAGGLVQAVGEDQGRCGRFGAGRHAPGHAGAGGRKGSRLPFISAWGVMASTARGDARRQCVPKPRAAEAAEGREGVGLNGVEPRGFGDGVASEHGLPAGRRIERGRRFEPDLGGRLAADGPSRPA